MSGGDRPLPSSADEEEVDDGPTADETEEVEEEEPEETAPAPRPAPRTPPARPNFKISTFLYVFLGLLGLYMLIDQQFRNGIAGALGVSPGTGGPTRPST